MKSRVDILIEETAKELSLSVDLVDDIVAFQFKSAYNGIHNTSSIEISGLGKFSIRPVKAEKRLKRLGEILIFSEAKLATDPLKFNYLTYRIATMREEIEFLKSKI